MKTQKSGIIMVIGCSVLGTIAQLLFKGAANRLASEGWHSMLTNPYLFFGYVSYGCSTCLLILALKKGQLSVLYPFIALTFVWVSILSPLIFESDSYNIMRLTGVFCIVAGVSFIGWGSNRAY